MVKMKVILELASTATPLRRTGLNRHWRIAFKAASASNGWPASTQTSSGMPLLSNITCSETEPSRRLSWAMRGYVGHTRLVKVGITEEEAIIKGEKDARTHPAVTARSA